SYCSGLGVEHRLRMSDLPVIVRPWLGWLLGEVAQSILSLEEFDKLWETRAALCPDPFVGEERDSSWALLHSLSAGKHAKTLDLVQLRNIVARSRPPIELCYSELGSSGPILSTIHASKGREADMVVLAMPRHSEHLDDGHSIDIASIFEEGRVY